MTDSQRVAWTTFAILAMFFSYSPSLFPFFHLDFLSFPDSGSCYQRFFVSMSPYGCQVCQGLLDLFSQNSVPAVLFLHFHASVFYNLWQPRRVSVGRLSPRRSRPRVSPPPPGGYLHPHHISTYPQPLLGRDVRLHQVDISTSESQKAKTFPIARFMLQKLSG